MGPKVSRVKSTKLDSWTPEYVEIMDNIGNEIANSYWEYNTSPVAKKLTQNSTLEERIRYAQDKYIRKKFVDPAGVNPVQIFLEKKSQGIIEPPQINRKDNQS